MSERRVSDEQARAIATYKSGSENEPGIEARTLARDLLDSRAENARLRELLRGCADELDRAYEAISVYGAVVSDEDGGLLAQVRAELEGR